MEHFEFCNFWLEPSGTGNVSLVEHCASFTFLLVELSDVSLEHFDVFVEHSDACVEHIDVSVEHSDVSVEHFDVSVEHSDACVMLLIVHFKP